MAKPGLKYSKTKLREPYSSPLDITLPRASDKKNINPTERDYAIVRKLSAYGITKAELAKRLGISRPTFDKHFADDFEIGKALLLEEAADNVVQAMRQGNVLAAQFLLKNRLGWHDNVQINSENVHSHISDAPLDVEAWKKQYAKPTEIHMTEEEEVIDPSRLN